MAFVFCSFYLLKNPSGSIIKSKKYLFASQTIILEEPTKFRTIYLLDKSCWKTSKSGDCLFDLFCISLQPPTKQTFSTPLLNLLIMFHNPDIQTLFTIQVCNFKFGFNYGFQNPRLFVCKNSNRLMARAVRTTSHTISTPVFCHFVFHHIEIETILTN